MALMSPTEANAFIGSRLGVTTYRPSPTAAVPVSSTPPPGTAIISRPVVSLPISTVPTRIPTALPQPALPQPALPPTSVSVVSAGAPLPVLQRIGPAMAPPLSPGAANSIAQPSVTPNQVATQYGAYQEPQQYSATLPVVSIPSSTDVGTPTTMGTTGSTVAFGLTENTWLLILIAAAVVLFLVSK